MTYLIALVLVAVGALITAAVTGAAYRAGMQAGTDRTVGALRVLQGQLDQHSAPHALIAATANELEDT
jgi:Tfp pilus assembly protein PilV